MHTILQGGTAENRCVVVLQLLGVDGSVLREALTHKKLTAKGEEVTLFLFFVSRVFSCLACSVRLHNFVSYLHWCVTDDQPAQLWAGDVCPWRLGQGRVWSDLHLVGGEDQPVSGSEGEVTLLITTQIITLWGCRCVLPLISCSVLYMLCRMNSTAAVRAPHL